MFFFFFTPKDDKYRAGGNCQSRKDHEFRTLVTGFAIPVLMTIFHVEILIAGDAVMDATALLVRDKLCHNFIQTI